MRLKLRFSKDKKGDVLRFSVAGLVFFALALIAGNRLPPPLNALESGYVGYVLRGDDLHRLIINEEGVALIKDWIDEQTHPTYNPVTIFTHAVGHRQHASFYDLIIGMRAQSEENGFREYALFLAGNTLYIQVEPVGSDRVLKTSFSLMELEDALSVYTEGRFMTFEEIADADTQSTSIDPTVLRPEPFDGAADAKPSSCPTTRSLFGLPLSREAFTTGPFPSSLVHALFRPAYHKHPSNPANPCGASRP